MIYLAIAAIIAAILVFFIFFSPPEPEKTVYGVVFSQKHSANMGLDWKENYSALLEDLKVKDVKIAAHWDLIEPEAGKYDYGDLDWQLEQAKAHGARVLLVLGMKTPRWPECHIPEWAAGIGKEKQQEAILAMLSGMVRRYGNRDEIVMWQVENEPLFMFGNCPWMDKKFLRKEVDLVRSLDPKSRPVMISDSGESSFWFNAASIGDIVGTTLYRKVWFHEAHFYVDYPIPPSWYWLKAELIKIIFKKRVLCVELQAEPWCPSLLYDCKPEEQKKTMDVERFGANLDFARKTGFDTFYLWGGEWWYWQKQKNNDPSFWEAAGKLWR